MIGLTWVGDIDHSFLFKLTQTEISVLKLCSGGGDVDYMNGALDIMRDRDWQTHGFGRVMSAAVPIIAIGAKGHRTASPLTRFMVHAPRIFVLGDMGTDEIKQEHEELKRAVKVYCDTLGACTKKTAKWWEKQMDKDKYFGAEEAKALGLIDEVA